jgi:hypothetical protein
LSYLKNSWKFDGMFEHFSEQSMKVMALADREAAALKHDRVGTGEILVGLLGLGRVEGSGQKFRAGQILPVLMPAI